MSSLRITRGTKTEAFLNGLFENLGSDKTSGVHACSAANLRRKDSAVMVDSVTLGK
jgi:hypothetical protein